MYLDFIKKHFFYIILVILALFYFAFDPFGNAYHDNNSNGSNNSLSFSGAKGQNHKGQNQKPAFSDLNPNQHLASADNKQKGAIPAVIEEGKHYRRLDPALMTEPVVLRFVLKDPGKIQVIEFFNYACYWCQQLNPHIVGWAEKQSDMVAFYQLPVVFGKGWDVLGKTFLVVKSLNKNKELDTSMFEAIHQKNLNLGDEAILKKFLAEKGISESEFTALYQSFSVEQAFTESKTLYDTLKLTTSPVILITGPSGGYVTTAPMAGNEQALLAVIDHIIEKESIKLKEIPVLQTKSSGTD